MDIRTARLAVADERNRAAGADVLECDACAGLEGEFNVACDHGLLRGAHGAQYAEFFCGLTAVVDAGGEDKGGVFLVE